MLEEKLREAIVDELKRQAAIRPHDLSVSRNGHTVKIDGKVDLDDLVMVITGSMAGGP